MNFDPQLPALLQLPELPQLPECAQKCSDEVICKVSDKNKTRLVEDSQTESFDQNQAK